MWAKDIARGIERVEAAKRKKAEEGDTKRAEDKVTEEEEGDNEADEMEMDWLVLSR